MMKKFAFPATIILSLIFFTANASIAKSDSETELIDGGQCSYDEHDGVCKVLNLYFNESKSPTKLVKFKFAPYISVDAKTIKLLKERNLIGTDQEDTLDDFAPNDWTRHQKLGLEIGDNVSCKLKIIKSGTCIPVIFSMQKVIRDPNAYSDLESRQIIANILVPIALFLLAVIIIFSVKKTIKKRKTHHKHKSGKRKK